MKEEGETEGGREGGEKEIVLQVRHGSLLFPPRHHKGLPRKPMERGGPIGKEEEKVVGSAPKSLQLLPLPPPLPSPERRNGSKHGERVDVRRHCRNLFEPRKAAVLLVFPWMERQTRRGRGERKRVHLFSRPSERKGGKMEREREREKERREGGHPSLLFRSLPPFVALPRTGIVIHRRTRLLLVVAKRILTDALKKVKCFPTVVPFLLLLLLRKKTKKKETQIILPWRPTHVSAMQGKKGGEILVVRCLILVLLPIHTRMRRIGNEPSKVGRSVGILPRLPLLRLLLLDRRALLVSSRPTPYPPWIAMPMERRKRRRRRATSRTRRIPKEKER